MLRRTRLAVPLVALLAAWLTVGPAGTGTAGEGVSRTVTITAVEPRDDVFFAKGMVEPAYAGRIAIMQRKLRRERAWSDWKKFRTTDESRYRRRIEALRRPGVVCYRVRIRASGAYAESRSDRVCIRTFRA